MHLSLDSYRLSTKQNRQRVIQALGWFSIGLGLAELLAPRALCRLIGVKPRPLLTRLLGLREITSGIGILTQPEDALWLKSRVAGDAMDLGLLGVAFLAPDSKPGRLVLATAAVAGVTAVDSLCSEELSAGAGLQAPEAGRTPGSVYTRRSIIVNRPPEQLYELWRKFNDLPRFMRHVVSVRSQGESRWHWTVKGPAGLIVEWDAEVTEERPNEKIAWRSLPGGDVDHTGSVQFARAPGNRGTIVRVEMTYRTPAGKTGATLVKLLGQAPEKHIAGDLLRFKQLVETGEIARTEGQPAGRTRSTSRRYDDLVRA